MKITKWDVQLAVKLAARELARSECKYGEQYILECLKDIDKYLGKSNLPSVQAYYDEIKS